MTKTIKWFHHCPICRGFATKKSGRLVTKAKYGHKQCWHIDCLKDELSINKKLKRKLNQAEV